MATRLSTAAPSKSGSIVPSKSRTAKNNTKKRVAPQQDSDVGGSPPSRKPKKKRTVLPHHGVGREINIIIPRETASATTQRNLKDGMNVQDISELKDATRYGSVSPKSSLEQTSALPAHSAVSNKIINNATLPVTSGGNGFNTSTLMGPPLQSLAIAQSVRYNTQGSGNAILLSSMLFTKRAAITNLATLSRSIIGAVKGYIAKSHIVEITKELAYAECTSSDIKQYMLASPDDEIVIRRIWPELVIFNALGLTSYEIIGQSLVEWGPTGINGLEELELIVLGWEKLAERKQLSRLDSLVEHKNEDRSQLSHFLHFRGAKLNARFWLPKGLKKLREDIWEVIDNGQEFQRKHEAHSDPSKPMSRHLSLLEDGTGIYRFRLNHYHKSAALPPIHDGVSAAAGASVTSTQEQFASR